jgi:hypothetical protein
MSQAASFPALDTVELSFGEDTPFSPCAPLNFALLASETLRARPPSVKSLRITDDTCAGANLLLGDDGLSLIFASPSSKEYTPLPRWIKVHLFDIVSVEIERGVFDNNMLRALYHRVPLLRCLVIRDSLIDFNADAGQTLSWSFLWEQALHTGDQLAVLDVTGCSYGRRKDKDQPLQPLEPGVALDMSLKRDARALGRLHERVEERKCALQQQLAANAHDAGQPGGL